MNRKNLLLLAVIIAGTLAIMAGCTSPQFGAPGTTGAAITGRVATPESCFSDACDNPFITEGKPLPGATALFYGGDSGKLKIEGETAVSYTHLDVYKRQEIELKVLEGKRVNVG